MRKKKSNLPLAMAQRIEVWPIGRVVPYAKNARTHSEEQVAQVAASIAEFGFTNPILVDSQDGIVAGHCRLKAARRLGLTEIPVIPLDHLTAHQRRAYIIADNKLAENAGWDDKLLHHELTSLAADDFNLELLGFSEKELESLLEGFEDAEEGAVDPDEAPEALEHPVSSRGDLWLLGEHCLLVGDATDSDDVRQLMGGESADIIITDPPYNVDYEGYTEERLKLQGDRMTADQYRDFLATAFAAYRSIVVDRASLYIFYPSIWHSEFQEAVEAAGFVVRVQLIWGKNHFAWGHGRYKFAHEPILYCHVAGQSDQWYGDKTQSTLWLERKPSANRLHPTMKPVELIDRALVNSSRRGQIVADFFGGAGSTLISAHRMGRRARLMELDPRYADVILRRWAQYTTRQPTLTDGTPFIEVERQRLSVEQAASC